MKALNLRKFVIALAVAVGLATAAGGPARAELADLADVPLANAPSDAVLPNLMYILDDSGSMQWDYMPDNVLYGPGSGNATMKNCKTCNSTSCTVANTICRGPTYVSNDHTTDRSVWGEPPYHAVQLNQIWYNPDIYYSPPLDYKGNSVGDAPADKAYEDYYIDSSLTKDLTAKYPEVYYCDTSSRSGSDLADKTKCLRNGIDNVATSGYFLYWKTDINNGGFPYAGSGTDFYNQIVTYTTHPYYFTIAAHEWCSDTDLVNCSLTQGGTNTIAAPIRYCGTTADAADTNAVTGNSGSTPKCRKKYDSTNYKYPRYGRFTRVDIVSTTPTYTNSANAVRPDCVSAASCTYAEELQNFANWYSYYRTRMNMMKTATGRAFLPINDRYRVGFITINPDDPVSSDRYLPLATFESGHKEKFYDILTKQTWNGGTPLREALARVGRHYGGKTTGINDGMDEDPITHSCQQNFALLTTDGYWNDSNGDAIDLSGNEVKNQDNTPTPTKPFYVSRPTGTLDGLGQVDITETPTTILEQAICSGNGAVLGTTCGCTGIDKLIKQRTKIDVRTVKVKDSVQISDTTATTSTTYQDIGACTLPLIITTVTPVTVVEQKAVVGANQSNFTAVGGVTAGMNQAGVCSAGNGFARIKQRTTTYNSTVVTTDGVAAPATLSGVAYAFSDPGSCVSVTTQEVVPVTETVQWVGGEGSGVSTAFSAAANGVNNQTTYTCTGSGTRTVLHQRRTGYNKTLTTTGAGATTTTYSTNTSGPTYTVVTACSTGGKTAAGSVKVNGTSTITITAGTPAAAATTTTNGAATPTSNGGTTLVIALSPNPTSTIGASTLTVTYTGTESTLADVAMYYYKNDLRTGAPTSKSEDNVPTTAKDVAPHQHMVTFALGLGLQGLMDYRSDYETATSGDFAKIKSGTDTTCQWKAGVCNWPAPSSNSPSTLDDLWHAAVNGRGVFYSASNPNSLADGLSGALSALKIQTAAAAASATSSPNVTETDNYIYSSTFRTVKWDGQIEAQRIDTTSGEVLPTIVWDAQSKLDGKVSAASDTRTIHTFDGSVSDGLKPFLWGDLTADEQAFFANKCTALSQCSLLTVAQKAIANDGQNMVNYLRGQSQHEASVYRDRDHVLGDPVNATPAYIRAPRFGFNDAVTPLYETFKTDNKSRQGVLYIAANDGMLHAFNGDSGAELWSYVPRMVTSGLHLLATDNWDVKHQYSVDGSPQFMDVFDSSASKWKTILVAGLNKGGRGFYALDVTDPASPKGMWEICSDAALCDIQDDDIGYSFGYPIITKRATDGKWVVLVTSGINNVSPGSGRGYLYILDAFSGKVLEKVDTGEGDTTTPSGFAKISAYANNFNADNTATYVYGGDLLGNVWRFDMTSDPPTVLHVATLTDASGNPQSITTRPELGVVDTHRVLFIGTGRYLGEDDLSDPATLSLPWAYQQSLYAIKENDTDHGKIRSSSPGLVKQTITTQSTEARTVSNNDVDWTNKDGWYMDFNPGNVSPGERVNLDPQLVLGTLVVVSNVPNNNACTVGGDSWVYQLDYRSGSYVASAAGQQAAQKFTGQTIVGTVVVRLPSGVLKAIATGATGTKESIGVNVGGSGSTGRRVSWRELFR